MQQRRSGGRVVGWSGGKVSGGRVSGGRVVSKCASPIGELCLWFVVLFGLLVYYVRSGVVWWLVISKGGSLAFGEVFYALIFLISAFNILLISSTLFFSCWYRSIVM